MSEITVHLDDETIDKLAVAIAGKIVVEDHPTTQSNPPAANPRRTRGRNEPEDVPPPDGPTDDEDPFLNEHPTDAAPASTSRGRASSAGRANTSTTRRGSGSNDGAEKDKWGNTWRIGLLDAPNCFCDEPAAKVHAKSHRTGKWYDQWRCAKGAPSSDEWREKCDFAEFPPRGRG